MKIFYYTFGCKVNQYETENIRQRLEEMGHTRADFFTDADVCIINTCTVTAQSDAKCLKLMRRIRSENPLCILIAAGCMIQADSRSPALELCDIAVGSQNKTRIPQLLEEYIKGSQVREVIPHSIGDAIEPMTNLSVGSKTRAYIKIQDGCDMSCTYCVIPRARGHIRSKPLGEIKAETAALVASGHREIVLTGINLCCYGRELKNGARLVDAAEAACSAEEEFRLRLGSMEPELISDEDIARLSRLEKLCPHFHLSLQSGCDNTLRAMKRNYTSGGYRLLCEKLRASFPGCAITTDIMVGFPGESEEDFKQSLEFVREIGFADAHIFRYSRRAGTAADKMPGQIDGRVKQRRADEMQRVCEESRQRYLSVQVGTVQRVLFEKETSPLYHQGHTDTYIPVRITRESESVSLRRQFREVEIVSAGNGFCEGR